MKNQKLVLVSTFVMGLVSGVYLYVMGFAPSFSGFFNDLSTSDPELIVVGEQYGGCMMLGSCPSFRFDDSRDYRYVPITPRGEEATIREGRLSAPVFGAVIRALKESDLSELSEPVELEECASMVDGIDYSYSVLYEGKEYQLDTCTTRYAESSRLGEAFGLVWQLLER